VTPLPSPLQRRVDGTDTTNERTGTHFLWEPRTLALLGLRLAGFVYALQSRCYRMVCWRWYSLRFIAKYASRSISRSWRG
jgi:hypothetical protein